MKEFIDRMILFVVGLGAGIVFIFIVDHFTTIKTQYGQDKSRIAALYEKVKQRLELCCSRIRGFFRR